MIQSIISMVKRSKKDFFFPDSVCLNEMYVLVFRMIEVEVSETFGYFGIVRIILWMWLKICRKSLKGGFLISFSLVCMWFMADF